MEKVILLKPEELYYLGRFLRAKYIDYAYIASMDDIDKNYSLFESETSSSLVSKGIFSEDFSGNIEIDKEIFSLLKPIFFGQTETSLDICTIGENNTVSINKFHFLEKNITMVTGKDGNLVIKSVDEVELKEKVEGLVKDNYDVKTAICEEFDKEKATRFIAAKGTKVGQSAVVYIYLEADGIIYRESGEDELECLSREDFVNSVYKVIKGEF